MKTRKRTLAFSSALIFVSTLAGASPSWGEVPPTVTTALSEDSVLYETPKPSDSLRSSAQSAMASMPAESVLAATLRKAGVEPTLDVNDVAEYAKQERVSTGQARKEMLLEQQVGVLETWLLANQADSYTELRIERKPFRVNYLTTADPLTALKGAPMGNLTRLTYATKVDLSLQKMQSAAASTLDTLRASGLKPSLQIDAPSQQLVVSLPQGNIEAAQENLSLVTGRRAADVPVVIVPGGDTPAKRTYGGLWFDQVHAAGAPYGTCTSAFTAIRNDGIRVTYTAGHCFEELGPDAGDILLDGDPTPFKLDYEHFGGNQDIQQMYTTRGDVDQAPWIRDNLNPAGDPTPYFRDVFTWDEPRSSQTSTGTRIYKTGRVTGYTSGYLQNKNIAPSYVPNSTASFWRAGVPLRCGDSGGPVFLGNQALGIVSGGIAARCDQFTDGTPMIYMPMRNSSMNSKVLLRY